MKITVVGSGYVGLVSGICFAHIGHEVICVDKDQNKINRLKQDIIPIYEPGLENLLLEVKAAKKISFTTDLKAFLKFITYSVKEFPNEFKYVFIYLKYHPS
jgi:UDPglucose 6-dehydrogenase